MTGTDGSTVAIVPARGGSKRIPRKNIRPFLGKPLIARTLTTLLSSQLFDRVIVSTDDDHIADISESSGAEAPFLRPAELADDHTPTAPVVQHAISTLETEHDAPPFRNVCVAYPAAVFTQVRDLTSSLELLESSSDIDYVVPVTRFPAPIHRALRRLPDGSCEMLWPEFRSTRTQDLEETYHDAGQFYWGRRDAWMEDREMFGPRSRMVVLPRHRVEDIDTQEDWERAERLYRALHTAE